MAAGHEYSREELKKLVKVTLPRKARHILRYVDDLTAVERSAYSILKLGNSKTSSTSYEDLLDRARRQSRLFSYASAASVARGDLVALRAEITEQRQAVVIRGKAQKRAEALHQVAAQRARVAAENVRAAEDARRREAARQEDIRRREEESQAEQRRQAEMVRQREAAKQAELQEVTSMVRNALGAGRFISVVEIEGRIEFLERGETYSEEIAVREYSHAINAEEDLINTRTARYGRTEAVDRLKTAGMQCDSLWEASEEAKKKLDRLQRIADSSNNSRERAFAERAREEYIIAYATSRLKQKEHRLRLIEARRACASDQNLMRFCGAELKAAAERTQDAETAFVVAIRRAAQAQHQAFATSAQMPPMVSSSSQFASSSSSSQPSVAPVYQFPTLYPQPAYLGSTYSATHSFFATPPSALLMQQSFVPSSAGRQEPMITSGMPSYGTALPGMIPGGFQAALARQAEEQRLQLEAIEQLRQQEEARQAELARLAAPAPSEPVRRYENFEEYLQAKADRGEIEIDSYICGISRVAMEDPVMASSGQTYEREAIQGWIDTKTRQELPLTDPITRAPITNNLIENVAIRRTIQTERTVFERHQAQAAQAAQPRTFVQMVASSSQQGQNL